VFALELVHRIAFDVHLLRQIIKKEMDPEKFKYELTNTDTHTHIYILRQKNGSCVCPRHKGL
jgi:hypothetical protein